MSERPPASRRRVLLIGWDAADWQHLQPLLEAGRMPTLGGLMRRGAWGNLATLQPMVSPMLWTSIATGKTADQHGVLGFVEGRSEGRGCRPWSCLSRTSKSVWNILQQNGWRCHQVGWWASHPAEPVNGVAVSNLFLETRRVGRDRWVVPPGAVHPKTWEARLAPMRFFPDELDSEHLLPFVPRAGEIDQRKDRRLVSLAGVISDCVTIQAVATTLLEEAPWDFAAVYFDGIDHLCHGFMPFHPPRLAHVSESDFDLYREVVAGAYRFHDMMLERLLQLAGPDTLVVLCSDHGFLSGPNRPHCNPNDPAGPTLWHRDMGLLVLAGPEIRQESRIFGASLLDITPTILTWCGLPCGADMPGKPLLEVLGETVPPARIPTWEDVPGDDGRHPPGTVWQDDDTGGGDILTKQFAALGYVEDHGTGTSSAAKSADTEADYNLAQVFLSLERPAEAVSVLEKLVAASPWETRFIHQLANALTRAGWHAQCAHLLETAYPTGEMESALPVVRLILARACLGRNDSAGAARCLARAVRTMPALPGPYVELGQLAMLARRPDLAEHAFRRAIALDDSFPTAWQGLAGVLLQRREYAAALEAATEALRRLWQMADAHFTVGVCLAHLGRQEESRAAFGLVTRLRPHRPEAWRWLGFLPVADPALEHHRAFCRRHAVELNRERISRAAALAEQAVRCWPLPEIPPPAQRRHRVQSFRPARVGSSGKCFTVVSGLPRSGTSLMMQMLAAGGLPPQTDGIRGPDVSNPHGYFEWEEIRGIADRPELLDDPVLTRRAIKIVSPLLRLLPLQHRYRILFLTRPAVDVARSQLRMLEASGITPPLAAVEDLAAELERHRRATLTWLRQCRDSFDLLTVEFAAILDQPTEVCAKLGGFLGPELLPHPEAMAAVIRAGKP
ncbi:MAG: alkaline phosphatase family protein [Verrucomicrobiales bacterium]|nr:alkaline phosphatase family protein [Verrucomicrobiales bacterium]